MKIRTAAVATAMAMTALPAVAQNQAMASAKDPQGLVNLLDLVGYQPKLSKDANGDPKIEIDLSGYNTVIYFYGCDETTHADCTSLQFSAGFNRKKPWTAQEAIKIAEKWRFASVYLDQEGDPYVQWDIVTGDGIPAKVFMTGVNSFGDTLDEAAAVIFEGEE